MKPLQTKLLWKNLEFQKCPRCGSVMRVGYMLECSWCEFRISKGKVYEILRKKPETLAEKASKLLKEHY